MTGGSGAPPIPADRPMIVMPDLCPKHQWLLVTQAGYREHEPWLALILVAQIALMQAASCDDQTHERLGGDITKIRTLGCLACYKPDAFGEVVEAAKSHDLKAIKALGERWVSAAAKPSGRQP